MSESLELDHVIQRFSDSERALAEAADQIGRLHSAEQRASHAARTLEETAEGVRGFAQEAAQAASSLAEAQQVARRVLEAGGKILNGSELREVSAGFEELQRVVASLAETMSGVSSRLDSLDQRVGDVQNAEARAALLDRQLAHIRANVADRHLRKALESLPEQ